MQKYLLVLLIFSLATWARPMEDVAKDEVVDKEELEELEKRAEVPILDDEAARNARFNFGYSIQVTMHSGIY